MKSNAAALALVIAFLSPRAAFAGDTAAAEVLFQEGRALLEAGDYAAACDKLAASMDAEPSGGAALNLGRCSEEQGKTATAWLSYQRAATLFAATSEKDRESFAREQVERIEPTLSRLTVQVPSPVEGLVVERNGQAITSAALGTAVPVDPGEHDVVATAPEHESWQQKVEVGDGGATVVIQVPELSPRSAPPGAPPSDSADEASPGLWIAGGTLAGVGGVAMIVGGVLGGLVLSDSSKAEDLCGGTQCDQSASGREGRDVVDGAKPKAHAATGLLAAGGALTAAGVVLLILAASSDDTEPATALVPSIGPSGAGLTFTTRF